jgi:hypothetical protein
MDFLPIVEGRSCGDCTKCCEGFLKADITLKDGTPTVSMGMEGPKRTICRFVEEGVGCKAYEVRPDNPCRIFKCDWLTNPDMPESFKPSRSNAIFTTRTVHGVEYTKLIEAGRKLDSEVLSWAFEYYMAQGSNFSWNVLENIFWLGSEEFNIMMDKDYPALDSGHGKDQD